VVGCRARHCEDLALALQRRSMAFSGSMVAGNEFPQARDPEIGGPVLLGKATESKDPSQGMDKQKVEHTAMAEEDMYRDWDWYWNGDNGDWYWDYCDLHKQKVEESDMADILLNWPAFGTFNLFMCSKSIYTKFCALSIMLVQVVVPVGVFAAQYHSYNKGWCPSTGSPSQRVLMSGIALFYLVRGCLIYDEKAVWKSADEDFPKSSKDLRPWHHESTKKFVKITESGLRCTTLASYGLIDQTMHLTYESLVLLLNLWLVFIADSALDIVLNSLAMEFVGKIDDEFKVRYFDLGYGHVIAKDIMTQELHKPSIDKGPADGCLLCLGLFLWSLGFFLLPVVSFVMLFYGAACKP